MRTTKSSDVRSAAGRFSETVPALERIEAIDARLSEIGPEQKRTGGPLPRGEVADRLVSWLRSRREHFEHPPSGAAGERLPAPDVVSRLSANGAFRFSHHSAAEEVFSMVVWLLGPDLEERAREALARTDYAEGLPSAERARIKAALEAERARLVAEREGLVERCRAAGVEVAHLPGTRQKIEAAERAAEQQADARRRQAEVAEQIEAREARA